MAAAVAVGLSAWDLYSRASRIQYIGSWIAYLLPYQDPRIRELLERLGGRVDALCQPLNVCRLLGRRRASAVAGVAERALGVLATVEAFVNDAAARQQAGVKFNQPEVVRRLRFLLRELDYAVASVNLALSTLLATGAAQEQPQPPVSASTLLRASARLRALVGSSGDVCVCPGTLFRRARKGYTQQMGPAARPAGAASAAAAAAASERRETRKGSATGFEDWEEVDEGDAPPLPRGWRRHIARAALRVVLDARSRSYELHVEAADPRDDPQRRRAFRAELSSLLRIGGASHTELGIADAATESPQGIVRLGLAWSELLARQPVATLAFFPHAQRDDAAMRPLELEYVARLGVLENEHSARAAPAATSAGDARDGAFAHLVASDEELWLALAAPIEWGRALEAEEADERAACAAAADNDGEFKAVALPPMLRVQEEEALGGLPAAAPAVSAAAAGGVGGAVLSDSESSDNESPPPQPSPRGPAGRAGDDR